MATHLVCDLPDRFAKVALVNALAWEYHVTQCGESFGPVSVLLLQGAENLDRPLDGRKVESDDGSMTTRVLSTQDTALFWAAENGCDLKAVKTSSGPEAIVYDTCPDETSVSLYTFQGIGNHWPRLGDYTLNQFGVDATDLLAQFFTTDSAPVITQEGTADVYGGEGRSYWVYVPPTYDPATPLPLVMVLHGRFGNGSSAAYVYDMNQVARREGFIAVYPDGTHIDGTAAGREWNYLHGTPGFPLYGTDDVDFLAKLVDDLARDLSIDQSRLYVTGYSNGGFMTQRLACSAPDRWAGFASISASLEPALISLCQDQPPVPMLLMHGTLDDNIPFNGLSYGDELALYSVPDTAVFWATHDGCDPKSLEYTLLPRLDPGAISQVHRYIFNPCASGSEFDYYVIDGGGHTVPGTANRQVWEGAGNVNMDIHAGEVIWEFFQRHTLPSQP
jgi:polyhydroxybutyrate depolymerase